ncbi:MAG: hypothetical protein EPO68_09060 [Planctomycetota bacterium]|nr:MAG: hypothetical protein EPO68_09060 [Planctomycetota bacterium]
MQAAATPTALAPNRWLAIWIRPRATLIERIDGKHRDRYWGPLWLAAFATALSGWTSRLQSDREYEAGFWCFGVFMETLFRAALLPWLQAFVLAGITWWATGRFEYRRAMAAIGWYGLTGAIALVFALGQFGMVATGALHARAADESPSAAVRTWAALNIVHWCWSLWVGAQVLSVALRVRVITAAVWVAAFWAFAAWRAPSMFTWMKAAFER